MDRIVVREALTLDGIIYGPGDEIPPEVWLRLPELERNTLIELGQGDATVHTWGLGVAQKGAARENFPWSSSAFRHEATVLST